MNNRGKPARFGHAEVFAAIGLLSFLAARLLPVLSFPFTCPMKAVAGIPCATCGMTHAFVHLAHGEASRAFAASPLGALIAAGAWLFTAADAIRVAVGVAWPAPSERVLRGAAALGMAALLANWAYLVVRGSAS